MIGCEVGGRGLIRFYISVSSEVPGMCFESKFLGGVTLFVFFTPQLDFLKLWNVTPPKHMTHFRKLVFLSFLF